MNQTTTTTSPQPAARPPAVEPKGCADDCNLNHKVSAYARRHDISTSTIRNWRKKGFPVMQTPVGLRINCQQARAFMRGDHNS